MKPFSDAEAAKWAVVRERGRGRYILVSGVLGWGIWTAVLWSFLMSRGEHGKSFLFNLAFAIVGFPLGGWAWGAWMWSSMERRYRAWQQGRAA